MTSIYGTARKMKPKPPPPPRPWADAEISPYQRQVLELLIDHDGATVGELKKLWRRVYGQFVESNTISSSMMNLKDYGMVHKQAGVKKDPRWFVTKEVK